MGCGGDGVVVVMVLWENLSDFLGGREGGVGSTSFPFLTRYFYVPFRLVMRYHH